MFETHLWKSDGYSNKGYNDGYSNKVLLTQPLTHRAQKNSMARNLQCKNKNFLVILGYSADIFIIKVSNKLFDIGRWEFLTSSSRTSLLPLSLDENFKCIYEFLEFPKES